MTIPPAVTATTPNWTWRNCLFYDLIESDKISTIWACIPNNHCLCNNNNLPQPQLIPSILIAFFFSFHCYYWRLNQQIWLRNLNFTFSCVQKKCSFLHKPRKAAKKKHTHNWTRREVEEKREKSNKCNWAELSIENRKKPSKRGKGRDRDRSA